MLGPPPSRDEVIHILRKRYQLYRTSGALPERAIEQTARDYQVATWKVNALLAPYLSKDWWAA